MNRCVWMWMRPVLLTGLWVWFSCAALGQSMARAGTPIAGAVGAAGAPDTSVGAALRSLALRADVVFAGRVAAIRRGPVTGGSTGIVSVDFNVEQTLQGTVARTYTLREWGGLWAAGQHRYWVGERVVMFVRAASAAGLSSPVDGMEGVVPLVQENALSEPLLDLRRVASRVLRAQGAPMVEAASNAISLSELRAVVQAAHEPVRPELVTVPLPVGIVSPRTIEPTPMPPVGRQVEPRRETLPLEALLRAVDPERGAVGESLWGAR